MGRGQALIGGVQGRGDGHLGGAALLHGLGQALVGRPDVTLVAVEERQRDGDTRDQGAVIAVGKLRDPEARGEIGDSPALFQVDGGLALGDLSDPAGEVWILCETLDQIF